MLTQFGRRLDIYQPTPPGTVYVRCPECGDLHFDPRTGICGNCDDE